MTRRLLGLLAVVAVLYAGLCKVLLFRDLEYVGSDFYSFLEMTWSWHYTGRLLYDNVYGYHSAIHNFYLLLALSPLTIPLGAYGLILGLLLPHLLAVLRIVSAPSLDLPGRLAILAAVLSPIAYFVLDHPGWGFHPELLYPPLTALFALELLEGRRRRAFFLGLLLVLVKEDGAVLVAGVLLAYFADRLGRLPREAREERRKMLRSALLGLFGMTVVFALGLALMAVMAESASGQAIKGGHRIGESIRLLLNTLARPGNPYRRWRVGLQEGLAGYALLGVLILLPLAARALRGFTLLLHSWWPIVLVLVISSSGYEFARAMMLWPPRLATLLALVVACVVFASRAAPAPAFPGRAVAGVAALAAVSWALQLILLARLDYSPWPRLQALALLNGRGYRVAALPANEVRFLRCVAGRLPGGLPVSTPGDTHPFFHRQSIVFEGFEAMAARPPRLRVVPASEMARVPDGAFCTGPGVGGLVVEAECALVPLVAGCEAAPPVGSEAH